MLWNKQKKHSTKKEHSSDYCFTVFDFVYSFTDHLKLGTSSLKIEIFLVPQFDIICYDLQTMKLLD